MLVAPLILVGCGTFDVVARAELERTVATAHKTAAVSLGKPDAAGMKDLDTREHEALRRLLKLERQKLEWTQDQVARKIGRRQSFVSAVESGQHRVSVVEFLRFAAALGFDPCAALKQVAKAGKPGAPGRR